MKSIKHYAVRPRTIVINSYCSLWRIPSPPFFDVRHTLNNRKNIFPYSAVSYAIHFSVTSLRRFKRAKRKVQAISKKCAELHFNRTVSNAYGTHMEVTFEKCLFQPCIYKKSTPFCCRRNLFCLKRS